MAISLGQSGLAFSGSSSSTTSSVATSASGSVFIIVVAATTATLTCSDSKGNTYTAINAEFTLNWGGSIKLFYCENGTGGSGHTFTGSTSGGGICEVFFLELVGALTSSSLDQTTAWISDTSSPYTTNTTGTTSQSDEIAIVVESIDSFGTTAIVWGNGYTLVPNSEETNASRLTGGMGYKILSSTGTESGSITSTNSGAGNGIVFTFKAASSGIVLMGQMSL